MTDDLARHDSSRPIAHAGRRAAELMQHLLQRGIDALFDEVAPGVARLGVVFVNVYALNAGEGKWFLVDTGLPGFAGGIRRACEQRFDGRPPEGIVLTHAHFDHAGNAQSLAKAWNVPIYIHPLERPYVTGESDYPPVDPTPGGAIAFMSRAFPSTGYDLSDRIDLRDLAQDGTIPGLPGWRSIHTPGHTAGHVSLFREYDKLLIAGDALATMDLDSWPEHIRRRRQICRPPVPLTPDWPAAKASLARLADLEPQTVGAGHGLPLWGRYVTSELEHLAETLQPPSGGRYASPARYDADGQVDRVPPAPPDPMKPKLVLAAGIGLAGIGLAAFLVMRGLTQSSGGRA